MHTFTVYTYSYGITLLQQLGNFFEKMILKNYPSHENNVLQDNKAASLSGRQAK